MRYALLLLATILSSCTGMNTEFLGNLQTLKGDIKVQTKEGHQINLSNGMIKMKFEYGFVALSSPKLVFINGNEVLGSIEIPSKAFHNWNQIDAKADQIKQTFNISGNKIKEVIREYPSRQLQASCTYSCYQYHYGYNAMSGKYEYHYGNTSCNGDRVEVRKYRDYVDYYTIDILAASNNIQLGHFETEKSAVKQEYDLISAGSCN